MQKQSLQQGLLEIIGYMFMEHFLMPWEIMWVQMRAMHILYLIKNIMDNDAYDDFMTNLYLQYQRYMVKIAYYHVWNIQNAEDIVSDCWLSIFRHEKTLEQMNEQTVKAYLFRCVYNRSIDFIRCQKRKEIYTCRNIAENPFFLTTYNSSQVDTEVFSECSISSYLSQLPHREKQVVKLKLEGYDTKSIAQFMKIDVGTVRKYWFKAKKRIRIFLESQSDN